MPFLLAGGTGKSASAHWIQVGAQVYGDKGAKVSCDSHKSDQQQSSPGPFLAVLLC